MWFSKYCSKIFIILTVMITAGSLLYISSVDAKPKSDKKVISRKKIGVERPNAKMISGKISYVDKNYVSIVIAEDKQAASETEVGFWIDETDQQGWRKKLSEMNRGDTIQIQFDEVEQDYDEKKENGAVERKTKIDRRVAKSVKFLSAAKKSLSSDNKKSDKKK